MDRPLMVSHFMVVAPGKVWLVGARESELLLADPEGWVEALIDLLDGKHSREAIFRNLSPRWPSLAEGDVSALLGVLDAAGFIDDADRWTYLRAPRRSKFDLASWGEMAHVAMSG